ncbi:hypothetical protein V2J09_019187 [Rumex salicifolius]
MAQLPLFGLASNLLGVIIGDDSPFRKAYQWVKPILEANDDLDKLKETIQLIQAVLIDAEKKQDGSATMGIWIQRVKDVLYEADDLFDEVATDYLLKQQQQQQGNAISKKVRSFFSTSNPFISNDSIAKGVEAIRKRLDAISKDTAQFTFILSRYENQNSNLMKRVETRPFVDEAVIVGRGDDKKAILDILLHDDDDHQSNDGQNGVLVVAIVGIGGMGKTTLAQLIYNHEEVQKNFNTKWWCCISDTVGEINVLKRIVESVSGGRSPHGHEDLKQLLKESVSNCEDESWELFRKIAFTEEQENSPNWVSLGRKIVSKCAHVPLAIKSVASLLCTNDTLQEWESIKNQKLLSDGSIRRVLKLSFDHLPSNLKNCFAYCSLYPKDSRLYERKLVRLWIAQGYVKPKENETHEAAGHGYFNELHLDIGECYGLQHMPHGFGELTNLQQLSDFKVSKRGGDLDELAGLNIQGQLKIAFDGHSDWSEDDELVLEHGHIPEAIDALSIDCYPSVVLWKEDPTPWLQKLACLVLINGSKVKKLPPLRRLPFLRALELWSFNELEYIEDEVEVVVSSNAPFFPALRAKSGKAHWFTSVGYFWRKFLRQRKSLSALDLMKYSADFESDDTIQEST